MSEQTNYTIRIDKALKRDFMQMTSKLGWNGSLLLRDYMRRIVANEGRDIPPSPLIDHDRERREAAVAYGQASVELEGLRVPEEAQELGRRFVNGDVDLAAFASAGPGGSHDR